LDPSLVSLSGCAGAEAKIGDVVEIGLTALKRPRSHCSTRGIEIHELIGALCPMAPLM
jgi:hypothetical protein